MRIIAGKYRGRVIKAPRTQAFRPTQDKVRGALFNILGERIAGASVLDLFAGSGALGIEALSRGAGHVVFVESDFKNAKLIEENLMMLVGPENFRVLGMDVLKALKVLNKEGLKFDIVAMDPPYRKTDAASSLTKKTLRELCQYDILKTNTLVIAEHFKKDELGEKVGDLACVRETRYGDTLLSFYGVGR